MDFDELNKLGINELKRIAKSLGVVYTAPYNRSNKTTLAKRIAGLDSFPENQLGANYTGPLIPKSRSKKRTPRRSKIGSKIRSRVGSKIRSRSRVGSRVRKSKFSPRTSPLMKPVVPDIPPVSSDYMKKKLVELKQLLKEKGIEGPEIYRKSKKNIIDDYLMADRCEPDKNIFCKGDKICDIRSSPGICVDKNLLPKRNIIQFNYNGNIIAGPNNAINEIKEKLSKVKELEKVLDSEDEHEPEEDEDKYALKPKKIDNLQLVKKLIRERKRREIKPPVPFSRRLKPDLPSSPNYIQAQKIKELSRELSKEISKLDDIELDTEPEDEPEDDGHIIKRSRKLKSRKLRESRKFDDSDSDLDLPLFPNYNKSKYVSPQEIKEISRQLSKEIDELDSDEDSDEDKPIITPSRVGREKSDLETIKKLLKEKKGESKPFSRELTSPEEIKEISKQLSKEIDELDSDVDSDIERSRERRNIIDDEPVVIRDSKENSREKSRENEDLLPLKEQDIDVLLSEIKELPEDPEDFSELQKKIIKCIGLLG